MNLEQALNDARPTGRLQRFKDATQPGLYLRMSNAGKRAYIVRAKGSTSDRKIGEPDSMTLEQARAAAAVLRPEPVRVADLPIAPVDFMARTAPSRAARVAPSRAATPSASLEPSPSLSAAFETFWRRCETRKARGRMSAKTIENYRSWWRSLEPALGDIGMDNISRSDIERATAAMPATTRNRCLQLLSAFFNAMQADHGMREGMLNPCKGIERDSEQWRARTLTRAELAALSTALDDFQGRYPSVVAVIRFLLSSPRRKGEALAMRWEHVNLDEGTVYLPRTKMGEAQVHALGAEALRVLRSLPRTNAWVFASDDKRGNKRQAAVSIGHLTKVWGAIREAAGCPDVWLHDLRRTVATWAAEGGATPHQLRAMLGHRTTAMADRYVGQVNEREPVNAATDAIARAMRGTE